MDSFGKGLFRQVITQYSNPFMYLIVYGQEIGGIGTATKKMCTALDTSVNIRSEHKLHHYNIAVKPKKVASG